MVSGLWTEGSLGVKVAGDSGEREKKDGDDDGDDDEDDEEEVEEG